MALLITRDIMESYIVILLTVVLRTVTSYTTEPIPNNAFIVLCSIVILIVLKVLSNIVVTIKELTIVELTIY